MDDAENFGSTLPCAQRCGSLYTRLMRAFGLLGCLVVCGCDPTQGLIPDGGAGDATLADVAALGDAAADALDAYEEPEDVLAGCTPGEIQPTQLRCTGLYSSFTKRVVAPEAVAYEPGYQLWSDGAQKKRYIQLPPGAQIDVTSMDDWTFPIGTKVWKEFYADVSGKSRLIETRYMVKGPDELWTRISYVWTEDGSAALAQPNGVAKVPGTTNYEVPSQQLCGRCHGGRIDNVLGFEAIALAAPNATGLAYGALQTKKLLKSTNQNHEKAASTLQVPGTTAEREALAYMHMNCGVTCHNPVTPGAKYVARLEAAKLGSVAETTFMTELVNQQSSWVAPGETGKTYRARPTDSSRSAIYLRMGLRDEVAGNGMQMPPFATHQVDIAGRQVVKAWIDSMTTTAGYPAPAP